MEGYKRPRQSPWETLPEHILLMAFKHLHIRQRRNVRLTCKAWAAVPVFTPRRLSRSKDMTIAQTEYLATLPTLQQLTLCQPRCIYAVSLLTQLTAIKLESYLTANLRPLKHLPRLSDLAIQGCAEIYDDDHEDICKLGDLLQLTQLRSLALGECKLRSLDAIAQLTWLTALSVAGLVGTDYEDDDPSLNDIGRLTQLRRLSASAPAIDRLRRSSVQYVHSWSSLQALTSLELNLEEYGSGPEIIGQLTNLQHLSFRLSEVERHEESYHKRWHGYHNGWDDSDHHPDASSDADLEEDPLSGNRQWADVRTILAPLQQLTSLQLSGDLITSAEGLDKLPALRNLCLSYTEVRDVSPVFKLTGLTRLDLSCPLDMQPADFAPQSLAALSMLDKLVLHGLCLDKQMQHHMQKMLREKLGDKVWVQ